MIKTRIKLKDTVEDILIKMSEGNFGALRVCSDILKNGPVIDPDNCLGGIGVLMALDTHNIYGPSIWMLYKDVCKENLSHMIAVLRAVQLGFISTAVLKHAIENTGDGIDISAVVKQVKERLPRFQIL